MSEKKNNIDINDIPMTIEQGSDNENTAVEAGVTEEVATNEVPLTATSTPEDSENGSETDKKDSDSDKEKKEKGGRKSLIHSSSVLGNKTIEDVINREAKEEQDTTSPFSLSKTLGGVIIARAVQRQIGLVLLVCAFLIIYINNRYVCQKKLVEIDRIESKIVSARYKSIVCSSTLTEKSRESNIMDRLRTYGDSTLTIPKEPPYLINVKE